MKTKLGVAILIIAALLPINPLFQAPVLGEEGWTADQTSVSQLSPEEQPRLTGVPMEVLEWERSQASEQPARESATYTYPSNLDWRNYGGQDWTTPIRDQAGCSSCAAFATTGTIESRLEIAMDDPDLNPDLSEGHPFFCGTGSSCGLGWSPSAAMNFARDTGIVDEACYPYTDSSQTCNVCADWQDRVTQISDWVGITDVADMKQALADHGPFEATMVVYADFLSYSRGVYRHRWGALIGGHAVTIVGYNDDEGYWIAKNSWGTDWGENGWFKIGYGECDIDFYAYVPLIADPSSYQLSTSASPSEGGAIAADPLECDASTCESGTDVILVLVASPNPGYEFTGWSGDVSGTSNPTTIIIDADKSVTAHFVLSGNDPTHQAFMPLVMAR